MTEELMLAGCLNNDSASQEALYSRFSPRMLGVCYRFAKSREDAEDMLQEGFIKVFTQSPTSRGHAFPFVASNSRILAVLLVFPIKVARL